MWNYLPFNVGFPDLDVFMLAVPTAVIAYVIAFGDIIVGQSLMQRADELRTDEVIENNVDRIHLVTAIRNALHAFFAPYPGLAGPLWTAVAATMAERYKYGRKAMDSIYSLSLIHIFPCRSRFPRHAPERERSCIAKACDSAAQACRLAAYCRAKHRPGRPP